MKGGDRHSGGMDLCECFSERVHLTVVGDVVWCYGFFFGENRIPDPEDSHGLMSTTNIDLSRHILTL